MDDAQHDGACILLGGPDVGKSTILKHIAWTGGRTLAKESAIKVLPLPIHIDLKRVKPASPAKFLRLLAGRALEECVARIAGFRATAVKLPSRQHPRDSSIEMFLDDMRAINGATGEVDLQPVFLLDDAEHIYPQKDEEGFKAFSRFKGNVVEILFGQRSDTGRRPAMIFAGTHRLLAQLRHPSSNLLDHGVTKHFVSPLDAESVAEIFLRQTPEWSKCGEATSIVELLRQHSGGHAGLLVSMIGRLVRESARTLESATRVIEDFSVRQADALRNIYGSLSPPARCLHRELEGSDSLDEPALLAAISDKFDPILHAEDARDELCYTGITHFADRTLFPLGLSYWTCIGRAAQHGSHAKQKPSPAHTDGLYVFCCEGENWWLCYPRESPSDDDPGISFTGRLGLYYIQFALSKYPYEVSYSELDRKFCGKGKAHAHRQRNPTEISLGAALDEGLSVTGESEKLISDRVRKEIRLTIQKISDKHPDLARHLSNFLKRRGGVLYIVAKEKKPAWIFKRSHA